MTLNIENKREDSIEVYEGLEFEVTWGDPNEEGQQWGRAVSGDIGFSVTAVSTHSWWVALHNSKGHTGEVYGVGDTFAGAIAYAIARLGTANRDAGRLRSAVRNG